MKQTANTLLIVMLLLGGCGGDGPSIDGTPVHDFRLETLDHDRFYLNEHRGRVVVLAFWATFCSHCKKELTSLTELAEQYPADRLTVAGICTDPENMTDVERIVSDLSLNYPILLDTDAKLFRRMGLRALPTTVVIDADGKGAMSRLGFNEQVYRQITGKIQFLLNGGIQ